MHTSQPILEQYSAHAIQGLAHFNQVMVWSETQTPESWTERVLLELVSHVGAYQGRAYRLDYSQRLLLPFASYGCPDKGRNITLGEGLLGQAAVDQELRILEQTESQHLQPLLSTMRLRPGCLLLLPLVFNKKTQGVIELAFLRPPSEECHELMRLLAPMIGANMESLMQEARLRKSLQALGEQELRLKRLTEASTEGLAFVRHGLCYEANPALCRMADRPLHELLDLSVAELFGALPKEGELLETTLLRPNGEQLPVALSLRHFHYQREEHTALTVNDISDRKRQEARIAQQTLQLEQANKEMELLNIIKQKNQQITSSLQYARKIQESILPHGNELAAAFPELLIFHQCRDVVGGDFYWFMDHRDMLLVACVDCTGHGIPGALMSMLGNSLLNKLVQEQDLLSPEQILKQLDIEIVNTLRQREESSTFDGMDIALCCFDKVHSRLLFSGAERPLWLVRQGVLQEYKGNIFSAGGIIKREKRFDLYEITLQKGDMCYLFSDGFQDQFSPHGKKFTSKRLKQLFTSLSPLPAIQQHRLMQEAFDSWKGNSPQIDDILVLGIRI